MTAAILSLTCTLSFFFFFSAKLSLSSMSLLNYSGSVEEIFQLPLSPPPLLLASVSWRQYPLLLPSIKLLAHNMFCLLSHKFLDFLSYPRQHGLSTYTYVCQAVPNNDLPMGCARKLWPAISSFPECNRNNVTVEQFRKWRWWLTDTGKLSVPTGTARVLSKGAECWHQAQRVGYRCFFYRSHAVVYRDVPASLMYSCVVNEEYFNKAFSPFFLTKWHSLTQCLQSKHFPTVLSFCCLLTHHDSIQNTKTQHHFQTKQKKTSWGQWTVSHDLLS